MQKWRVYIIHFSAPFHHARHYIGITNLSLEARFERHRSGGGARIIAAAVKAGIVMESVHELGTAPDGHTARQMEIGYKKHKKAHTFCPKCGKGDKHDTKKSG